MQAADGTARQRPRRTDSTNGHAPGAEQLAASNYPSSSEDEEREQTPLQLRAEAFRLRYSTPLQLIQGQVYATERSLFVYLFLFRCIVAIFTSRTVFAPDEHWQSLEIAHRIVFGYGYETWEWRDPRSEMGRQGWGSGPIRSPLYPAMFVPIYWILQQLALDNTLLLTLLPSLLQALLAAFTDLYTFKLARKMINERAAWITLVPTIFSLYTFHTSTRTLSNSAEAAFTAIALYYWPLSLPENSDDDLIGEMPLIDAKSLETSLTLFALSALLRPSNVLISLPLLAIMVHKILRTAKSTATLVESAMTLLMVGRACLYVGLYYGRLTFTPIAFFKRNVLESISIFYGQSPVHFYLSSALPFICTSTLPYTFHGIYCLLVQTPRRGGFDSRSRRWYGTQGEGDPAALKTTVQVTISFVVAMSFLGHKEVRFLQPIVPLLHIFEGYALSTLPSLQTLWSSRGRGSQEESARIRHVAQSDRSAQTRQMDALTTHTSARNRRHILLPTTGLLSSEIPRRFMTACNNVYERHGNLSILLLGAHVLPTIYLCFHSAGQVSVAQMVGKLSRRGELNKVDFLMPCHSTPWASHMHDERLSQDNNSRFITCEPPLDGQNIKTYEDESDLFYKDPYAFIKDRLRHPGSSTWTLPSHIAVFECLLDEPGPGPSNVSSLLSYHGYTVQHSWWNSLFHLDRRRRGRVLLLAKDKILE